MSFMNAVLATRVVSRVAGDIRLHGMVLSIAWDATGARNGSAGQGPPVSCDAACCNVEYLRRPV